MTVGISNDWFICVDWGVAYFRVFGYGLWWGSYSQHREFFSEREGVMPVLKFAGGRFRFLKPRGVN